MKKIFYTFAIILGFLILYPFIKSPHVHIYHEHNEIILENIFLGEYYLGFNKLKIQSIPSHTVICEIEYQSDTDFNPQRQHHVKEQIRLKKGFNDEQSIWGYIPKHTAQKSCLLKNETYLVSVWGNNGSGFSMRKRLKITFP